MACLIHWNYFESFNIIITCRLIFETTVVITVATKQASTNFQEYVARKPVHAVLIKKYFHVVRRILLHQWLQLHDDIRQIDDDTQDNHGAAVATSGQTQLSGLARWPPPSQVLRLLEAVEHLQKHSMKRLQRTFVPESVAKVVRARLQPSVRGFVGCICVEGRQQLYAVL